MTPDARAAMTALREAARSAASSGELPELLAELERVRVEVMLAPPSSRQESPAMASPARLLTPEEVGKRLGRSRWWVYRNKALLPVTRFPTGGWGVDEQALERWIRRRSGEALMEAPSANRG